MRRYARFVIPALGLVVVLLGFLLFNLKDSLVFFRTPTEVVTTISVAHTGAPQQLFQEGIGVVITGTWDGDLFRSDEMMVKHDEQYRTDDGSVYEPGEYPTGG